LHLLFKIVKESLCIHMIARSEREPICENGCCTPRQSHKKPTTAFLSSYLQPFTSFLHLGKTIFSGVPISSHMWKMRTAGGTVVRPATLVCRSASFRVGKENMHSGVLSLLSASARDNHRADGVEELEVEDHGGGAENGGEELDEAVAMTSTDGEELDEGNVEELRAEDHIGEDEDGGEEPGDENNGRGQGPWHPAHQRIENNGERWVIVVRSVVLSEELLEVSPGCSRACVGPGMEARPIWASVPG
jgi:hypothetical protein